MPDDLDIHEASPDEVVAAHRNVFDIWNKGLSLEEHVQSRLDSPKHSLAAWYVGCLAGRVVVSLGAYPMRFRIRGAEVPGIAVGSVYTVGEFRRRGFAAQLLQWVEKHQHEQGAALSLLYSDIDPDYYARLGYAICPSWEGWHDLAAGGPGGTATHRLVEFSAAAHLPVVMKLYDDYHGPAALAIARDEPYWQALLRRFPDERFFALADRTGAWRGYVRLGCRNAVWRITDFALADPSDTLAERLYAATLEWTGNAGAERVGGWLPASPAAGKFFRLSPRRTEITMIKSLSSRHPLDDDLIVSTDRFCEIDHV
jgi:GNAT superfamily N-acetyltransferase